MKVQLAEGPKVKNNYFDGYPVGKKQLFIMFIMIAGTFFEQIDNQLTSFVGPNVMYSLGISTQDWALMSTVTLVGMTLGGIVGGYISDAIGRKKVFLSSLGIVIVMAVGCGFTSNFTLFLAFRLLQGLGVMSMTVTFVTYLLEITPREQRGKWEGVCAGVGYIAIPFIGIVASWALPLDVNAWRFLFIASSIGLIPLIIGIVVMPESPRWLVEQGRVAEAEQSVRSLIHVNVDLSDAYARLQANKANAKALRGMAALRKLFGKEYRKRTIVLLVVCMAQTCPFAIMTQWNNITLQAMGLGEQVSLIITTVGTFGSPLGCFLGAWLGPKGGRKKSIAVSLALQIAAFLAYSSVASASLSNPVLLGTLYLLCLVFANCTLICCNPYYGESLPTNVRNFGSGIVHSSGRLFTAAVMTVVPTLMAWGGMFGVGILAVGLLCIGIVTILAFGWNTGRRPLEEITE